MKTFVDKKITSDNLRVNYSCKKKKKNTTHVTYKRKNGDADAQTSIYNYGLIIFMNQFMVDLTNPPA